MKKTEREFIDMSLEHEETDVPLLLKDDGRFYQYNCDTPFSGVRKIFFSKRFWEKKKVA